MDEEKDDTERSIEEFSRLSGLGDSRGWHFDREEIYSRQDVTTGDPDMSFTEERQRKFEQP